MHTPIAQEPSYGTQQDFLDFTDNAIEIFDRVRHWIADPSYWAAESAHFETIMRLLRHFGEGQHNFPSLYTLRAAWEYDKRGIDFWRDPYWLSRYCNDEEDPGTPVPRNPTPKVEWPEGTFQGAVAPGYKTADIKPWVPGIGELDLEELHAYDAQVPAMIAAWEAECEAKAKEEREAKANEERSQREQLQSPPAGLQVAHFACTYEQAPCASLHAGVSGLPVGDGKDQVTGSHEMVHPAPTLEASTTKPHAEEQMHSTSIDTRPGDAADLPETSNKTTDDNICENEQHTPQPKEPKKPQRTKRSVFKALFRSLSSAFPVGKRGRGISSQG